jgi:hypothetical protein
MSVPPGKRARLTRAAVGAVGLAVVATSTVALASVGSADASTRAAPVRSAAVGTAVAPSPTSPDQVSYTAPIAGSVPDGRQVTGTFRPTLSRVEDGVLQVRGRVRADIHNLNGSVTRVTQYRVWIPVKTINGNAPSATKAGRGLSAAAVAGACPVLNLVLGPLDLDLLGLVVHLDRVVLNIIAQSGAGNLLGNLLCAVAGLLDNTGPLGGLLSQISALLNSILAILQA